MTVKLMEIEEQQEVITALNHWFESQNINPLDSLQITMQLYAITMGICAPSVEELGKGLAAGQLDIEGIAMRSYLEKKSFE